jgi:glycogen debranching enzyme
LTETAVDEVIQVRDQFYILATSSRVDDRTRVLKDGDTFAVFDRRGDVHPFGLGEQGLYHAGTRFLSRLELGFGAERALLLGSSVRDDDGSLAVDLANPDLREAERIVVPADAIHLFRCALLRDGVLYQRFRLHNFAPHPVELPLRLHFDADFRDVFEVRGMIRSRRGRALAPEVGDDMVVLGYEGLDARIRRVRLTFGERPSALNATLADYRIALEPRGDAVLEVTAECMVEQPPAQRGHTISIGSPSSQTVPRRPPGFDEARRAAARAASEQRQRAARVSSSSTTLNDWLDRSYADLQLMLTETEHGPYPYAGIPWYSTVFGRDGIVTALETLWIDPTIGRGVLTTLAALQAHSSDAVRDAEPGKILHELRDGEMAALGEIPFGRYYGTVDATPLFVVLAGAYHERTGDDALLERLWPSVDAALRWMDETASRDRDGFLAYARRTEDGLVNQGWKDSHDAVFHRDGTLATGPIALCEVQAYAYAAYRAAAQLAQARHDEPRANALLERAEQLRERFEERFWCEDLGTYALAVDGRGEPCRVRTSNAGQVLFGGVASVPHAAAVASTMMEDAMFSGWGVRTVASGEARYNPMSYHNGSVWPHDNALVASGLARYGRKQEALAIFGGLLDASAQVELHRLPELMCGFPRRRGEGPTRYPVACSPQAWAVGAPFLLIEACLGMRISAPQRRVTFSSPVLPRDVGELTISGLTVGDATLDLSLRGRDADVSLEVVRRSGTVDVVIQG